jgi:hypothetical protein
VHPTLNIFYFIDYFKNEYSIDYNYIILPNFKQECWTDISSCIIAFNPSAANGFLSDAQISNDGESLIINS